MDKVAPCAILVDSSAVNVFCTTVAPCAILVDRAASHARRKMEKARRDSNKTSSATPDGLGQQRVMRTMGLDSWLLRVPNLWTEQRVMRVEKWKKRGEIRTRLRLPC